MLRRLSIARSLRLALIGLTVLLTIVAAAGVARLYDARQRYEDALVRSSSLATAAANLLAAGITEEEVLRDGRGQASASARASAHTQYGEAAAAAQSLAADDPPSARLVAGEVAAQRQIRALAASGQLVKAAAAGGPMAAGRGSAERLQVRQRERQVTARRRARDDSRQAVAVVVVAAVLALIGGLLVVGLLVATMRGPLEALVAATRDLAAGNLGRRVRPAGPQELQELGDAFNTMADFLRTAQRRVEDDRRRLQITIESLGDALLVTEQDATTIAAVNPRARELVPEVVQGGRIDAPGSPLPPLAAALIRETIVTHRQRTLAITAATLGSESDGVVWTVRDMSERARLERAKTEFVATASHELRSPLTSIKGFVELLSRSGANMTDRQREFVDIILRSTNRLVELVNDLLDVARIEADRVDIDRRPIDVGEAVREVAELMGPRIAEKHQELGVYVAAVLPPALADPGRVRQIVANLLTNAHLYTPEGGRLHVGVEPDRAWVQITVADSGRGMTAEERERVFERFYRGSDGGASGAGTGLGLSIVKSLVEMHDGEIEVASTLGEGTTFRVRLPVAVAVHDPGDAREAIRGRRVLVVDDEADVASLIARQLRAYDVETTIATSGPQALARLAEGTYDAVTLDILMPGMDGFEVLRRIRSAPATRSLPIVFVSVFSGRRELAGEWVVSKPIDADELREVVASAVRSGRSRALVVARDELRDQLEPSLDELGIEHEWVTGGTAAARMCEERRFELALVDVGLRNPRAILQALDLRGRRIRRAVILFSDGELGDGVARLGMEVVPVDDAARALLAAMRTGRPGQRRTDAVGPARPTL